MLVLDIYHLAVHGSLQRDGGREGMEGAEA